MRAQRHTRIAVLACAALGLLLAAWLRGPPRAARELPAPATAPAPTSPPAPVAEPATPPPSQRADEPQAWLDDESGAVRCPLAAVGAAPAEAPGGSSVRVTVQRREKPPLTFTTPGAYAEGVLTYNIVDSVTADGGRFRDVDEPDGPMSRYEVEGVDVEMVVDGVGIHRLGTAFCPEGPPDPEGWIVGTVANHDVGETHVEACGRVVPVDADGAFAAHVAGDQRCDVVAVRRDGLAVVRSSTRSAYVPPDDEAVVDLALPASPRGFAPFTVQGFTGEKVIYVPSDHPLPDDGIDPYWIDEATLVAIDGAPLDGLNRYEVERLLMGPVGDEVTLTLQARADDGYPADAPWNFWNRDGATYEVPVVLVDTREPVERHHPTRPGRDELTELLEPYRVDP